VEGALERRDLLDTGRAQRDGGGGAGQQGDAVGQAPGGDARAGDVDLRGGQVDADAPARLAGLQPIEVLVREAEADVEEPVAGAERGRRRHEMHQGLAGVVDRAGLAPVAEVQVQASRQ
jgi:hypothetical protein